MEDRDAKLQDYIRRLGEGEDLESVRKDFVENFKDVDASEIMKAEQDLMKSGMPYQQVQKLCDVHSALFHGATKQERIANAEKAVSQSLAAQAQQGNVNGNAVNGKDMHRKAENKVSMLALIAGHPVNIFVKENRAIGEKIKEIREALGDSSLSFDQKKQKFEEIRPVSIHYAKKGDLLYPQLDSRYGISGPAKVMWGVDDEIRDEVGALCKKELPEEEWTERAGKVLQRMEEMIYKEQNILLPICAQNFTEDEWKQMARDIQDYEPCLTERIPIWREAAEPAEKPAEEKMAPAAAEDAAPAQENLSDVDRAMEALKAALQAQKGASKVSDDEEVVLPTGHFTVYQLRAMLNTIPLEISFVDDHDINRYFNEGPKVFKRPLAALDREVYYCHPPKVEAMVRTIISQFRAGTKKSVEVWTEKQGHTFLVRYMAVYDDKGKFVGTMECVENMDKAREHFQGPKA